MRLNEDRLRESFPHFMASCFHYMNVGKPGKNQYRLAEFLQYGKNLQLVLALRGFGKSWIVSTYAAWCGYRDPNRLILTRSGIHPKAMDFVSLTKQVILKTPFLEDMIPRSSDRPEDLRLHKDGASRFDFGNKTAGTKDPSVSAYGILGMSTGSHMHVLIDDDVETKENSRTQEARKKLFNKISEYTLLLIHDQSPKHIVIGTYQSEDSTYKQLEDTHEMFSLPGRYPHPSETRKMSRLAPPLVEELENDPTLAGKPTCPERFPENTLIHMEAANRTEFALQILLDPTLSDLDRYPLRLRDLMVWPTSVDEAPDMIRWSPVRLWEGESPGFGEDRLYWANQVSDTWAKYQDSVMYIDPSGRGKDETGWCCGHMLNGHIWISGSGGEKDGHSDVTMNKLAHIAGKHRVRQILVEPNFGDGMWSKLLQPVVQKVCPGVGVKDASWAVGQKEARILDVLEPAFGNHRITLDPSVARDIDLLWQITRLTRERHALRKDDRVEALSGVVQHFSQAMAVNATAKAEEARAATFHKEIKERESRLRNGKTLLIPTGNPVVRRANMGSFLW